MDSQRVCDDKEPTNNDRILSPPTTTSSTKICSADVKFDSFGNAWASWM